ncbi:hypothetical protein E2320_022797, partial [Naja naja]
GILLLRFQAQEVLSRLDAAVLAGGLLPGAFGAPPGERGARDHHPGLAALQGHPSNLGLLQKKSLRWVVDQKACPTVATLSTQPFAIPLGKDWQYLNIDAFGRNPAQLKSQLVHHLRLQVPTLRGGVMCQLFLEPQLWLEMAAFCQEALGLELAKDYTEQYLLEADI